MTTSESAALHRIAPATAVAAVLIVAALPAAAQNLLTNPAFDSGHDGWQPNDSRIELRDRGDLGSPPDGGSGPGAPRSGSRTGAAPTTAAVRPSMSSRG